LGVRIQPLIVRNPQDLDKAFLTITRERLDAVLVVTDAISFNQRTRIAEFAAKGHLSTMYELRDYVEAGGLMAYGPSLADLSRRAAPYVDKILKGAPNQPTSLSNSPPSSSW
jgi:putative ABC transport system substrate-binding protein